MGCVIDWSICRQFADFLIAVEAEMAKVSWPTRSELIHSSLVVIITIIGLAAMLCGVRHVLEIRCCIVDLTGDR